MNVKTYRMWPIDVEALQFTGDNWAEMHEFTGHAIVGGGSYGDVFVSMEDWRRFAPAIDRVMMPLEPPTDAVIWIDVLNKWHPVVSEDWIIKSRDAFMHLPDSQFKETYTEVAEPIKDEEWAELADSMKEDETPKTSTDEPTKPGFYYNEGAAQTMIYLLDARNQWWAITDSLHTTKCAWGYIEQTVTAYPLKKLGD